MHFPTLRFKCIKHPRERWVVRHPSVAVRRVRAGLGRVISGRRDGEEEARAEPWDPLGVGREEDPAEGAEKDR